MKKYIVTLSIEGRDFPVKATAKNESEAGKKALSLYDKGKSTEGVVTVKSVVSKNEYKSPTKIAFYGVSSLNAGGRVLGSKIK